MKMFRWVAGVVLGGILAVMSDAGAGELKSRRESFESGGERIKVDVFGPEKVTRAVIVLHGAGGMMFDGGQMRAVARELAGAGMTVYVVNYFNRTGDWFVLGDKGLIAGFEPWLATVRDAVDWVSGRAGGKPVGVYGYSMGGFLGVAAAAGNPRVGALVEQSGGIWDKFDDVEAALPPTLVAHGTADERVYFERNTDRIKAVVAKHGTPLRVMAIEGGKHRLDDTEQGRVNEAAVGFFERWLEGARRGEGE